MMSDFEILCNDILLCFGGYRHRLESFGYESDPKQIGSIFKAMFVNWIFSVEESRAQTDLSTEVIKFHDHILPRIPDVIDSSSACESEVSLAQRVSALWGIRIAYTHGGGYINRINSEINKQFAISAPDNLSGVVLDGEFLNIDDLNLESVIRTMNSVRTHTTYV